MRILPEADSIEAEAAVYSQLGHLYLRLGDLPRARSYLQDAVSGYEQAGDAWRGAMVRRHLGTLEAEAGHLENALEHHAAALGPIEAAGHAAPLLEVLTALVRDHLAVGSLTEASAFARRAAMVAEQVVDVSTRVEAGLAQAELAAANGQPEDALAALDSALATVSATQDPMALARLHHRLFEHHWASGAHDLAWRHASAAMANVETLRGRLEVRRLGPAWAARSAAIFEDIAGALLQEAARTQDEAMLDRGLAVVARGIHANLERQRLGHVLALDSAADGESLRDAWRKLSLASAELTERPTDAGRQSYFQALEQFEAGLAEAGLGQALAAPVGLSDWRDFRESLPDGAAALVFVPGDPNGLAVALTRDAWHIETLPARHGANELVMRVLSTMREGTWVEDQALLRRAADAFLRRPLADLDVETLIIVTGDALSAMPWAVLDLSTGDGIYEPAIDRYALVQTTGPGELHAIGEQLADATIAVLADPHFDPSQLGWVGTLAPLPQTALEAQGLVERFGSGRVAVSVGPNAVPSRLLGRESRTADILHLATHGFFDPAIPELVGLALSAEGEDSGLVTLHDLHMVRFESDLVVISGCETGLGQAISSEGLNSLARTFLAQGARSTVSTLWPVTDTASARFMVSFYDRLAAGAPLVHALASTQRELRSLRRHRSPADWGGYVLTSSMVPVASMHRERTASTSGADRRFKE